MKKVRFAALFATVMMGMMSCSGTPAYARENGNTMAVEKKAAETEKEPETESSQEEPDILSSVPLDPSVLARLTAGMDPDIVEMLLENRGRIVSREELMERLWSTDSFVDENTLSVNVNRLRKKLEGAGLFDAIRTRKGEGYIIEAL